MKTTIIIPNYNGLSFMEPCFEALEAQTMKDFKILVVDNGSTDGSVEWLEGAGDPVDLSSGKHWLFRCGKRGDQGGRYAVCDLIK